MEDKTLMVGLALDRPIDFCPAIAGDIAERFGARVIGVAASDLRAPTDRVVTRVGAGVIVAGICGHARFRESVLSNVRRRLVMQQRRCAFPTTGS